MTITARRFSANLALVLMGMGLWYLRLHPPLLSTLYPRCPLHSYLHILCPGCGGTRALFALLHGQIYQALRDNAFLTVLSPFFVGLTAITYFRMMRRDEFHWPHIPEWAMNTVLLLAFAFMLIRNTTHFLG